MQKTKHSSLAVILLVLNTILSVHHMISSYYFSEIKHSAFLFFATLLVTTLSYTAIWKIICDHTQNTNASHYALYTLTLTAMIQVANAAAIPLMEYTSSYSNQSVYNTAVDIAQKSLLMIVMVAVTWIFLYFGSAIFHALPRAISVLYSILLFLCSIGVFLFSKEENNTTFIMGVQVALPALVMMLIAISIAFHSRTIYAALPSISAILFCIAFVVKGETGIPLLTFLIFIVYYFFLCSKQKRWLTVLILLLICIGIAALFPLNQYAEQTAESTSFLSSLAHKVHNRVFHKEEISQVENAIDSIRMGGFYGDNRYYNIYAARSDFSIALILRYLGCLWLPLLLIPLLLSTSFGMIHFQQKEEETVQETIRRLAFIGILALIMYNLMANIGIAPVLGVSCFASGDSGMHCLLSGFLLGSTIYPFASSTAILEAIQIRLQLREKRRSEKLHWN